VTDEYLKKAEKPPAAGENETRRKLATITCRLVQAGIPLYEVMHLTGHKLLKLVQRYAHLAPDYADRAIQALDAIGRELDTPRGHKAALGLKNPLQTKSTRSSAG